MFLLGDICKCGDIYLTAGILAPKGLWHQPILLVATGFFTTTHLQFLKKSVLPKNVLGEGITAIVSQSSGIWLFNILWWHRKYA